MILRVLCLFLGALLSGSCGNHIVKQSRISEEIKQGEGLYSINLKIAEQNADQEISSSIFSQELSVWKCNFVEKYGDQQWQHFRSLVIKKYGRDEKMDWFLK